MSPLHRVVLVALLAALFPACKKSRGVDKTALQVQLWAEPASLDPALAEDGVALRVLGNVMDGLVGYDAQGKLEYRLASSHTVSSDGRSYVFELRPEARWSDGRAVRAQEFVDGIRRVLDPRTGARFASLLYPIRGARAFNTGKSVGENLGVRAEGERKVIFELDERTPSFAGVLTHMIAVPVRSELTAGKAWDDRTPVTGPYKIAYHRIDDSILLAPNEHFWGISLGVRAPVRPVMLRIVPDESTALNLFETGMLDLLIRFPVLESERLRKLGEVRVDPFLATYYLAFNTRKEPFKSRDARRAIAGSIDRAGVAKLMGSGEEPARGWISHGIEGFVPWSDPTAMYQDAVRSQRSRKWPELELAYDSTIRNTGILEKVQSDLKERLGLKVSLLPRDWKTHLKSIATDPPLLYRMGWQATIPDPLQQLRVFTSGDPSNFTGWSSHEYDRLVDRIEHLDPGPAREALVRKAQEILIDRESVVVPLFHYVQVHALSRRIARFAVNPFGVVRFNEIEIAAPSATQTTTQ